MRHLDRVLGIAVAVLGGAAFSGCQAPRLATPVDVSVARPARLAVTLDPTDDPPQFGSATPVNTAAGSEVALNKMPAPYRPPPNRAEIPPPALSPQSLWEPGFWRWNGARFVWSPGRYIERPHPDANWMPGYWEQESGGWVWVEGRWT